jgi:archaellum biogenesis ATPase FlaH
MTTKSFVNEIKNFYNTTQARSELEDMLQSNRLYKKSFVVIDFIRTLSGRDEDSYTIRETGKFLSDLINELKLKYEIKD